MRAFRLKVDSKLRPDVKAGMLVVPVPYDYGLASDDTSATGIPHISVTRALGQPFFTIPQNDLEAIELERPSDEYVKEICKISQGAACCRYLTISGGNGWSCEKLGSLRSTIDRRVELMTARADNCEGKGYT